MPLVYPSQSGYSQSPQSVPAIASRTTLYNSSLESVWERGGPLGFSGSGAAPGTGGGASCFCSAAPGTTPVFSETRIVSSIAFESAPPGAHFSVLVSLPCAIAFEYPKQSGYPQSPQSVPAIASSSTFCSFGLSSFTCRARAASWRPIAATSSPAALGLPWSALAASSFDGNGGGGASQAFTSLRVISPSGCRGNASAPLGGLYATTGCSTSGTNRSVRLLKFITAPSNSRVCWMAPVGQGSTQSPQSLHLPISMSNRSIRSFGVVFPSPLMMSMLMTAMGQARSQAWHAVQMSMSTSRKPR